ncbi:MAG: stage III sporulation protein AF [Lachnospirales bacterium]
MDYLENYLKNIATFLVIAALIEMILPNNNYKKYIKMFTGFIIMINMLKPIIGFTLEYSLEEYLHYEYDYEVDINENENIEFFLKGEIENTIKDLLQKNFNITVSEMKITFKEVSENYFYIDAIELNLVCEEDYFYKNKESIEKIIFYEYFEHLDNIYLTYST